MVKPWLQTTLERETREKWRVTQSPKGMALLCGHGMRVMVPNTVGLDRPFRNHDAERHFVGKIVPAHRPFESVRLPWPLVS